MENLSADVIEVRIIDADDRPDIGEEALAVIHTAVGDHSGEVSDILECWYNIKSSCFEHFAPEGVA